MKFPIPREVEQYTAAYNMAKKVAQAESEFEEEQHLAVHYIEAAYKHLEESTEYPEERAKHLMMSRIASGLAMKELAA